MIVISISRYYISKFSFDSIITTEDKIPGKPIDFNPDIEDEVIRDTLS